MSRSYVAGHRYPPHLWVDLHEGSLYQTVLLDRPARALENNWRVDQTNRRGMCWQVEIVGRAKDAPAWGDEEYRALAEVVVMPMHRWATDRFGRGLLTDKPAGLPRPFGDEAYGYNSGARISDDTWLWYSGGLICHQHIRGNAHWDAPIDLTRLHSTAITLLGEGSTEEPARQPSDVEAELLDLKDRVARAVQILGQQ